jgi:hypothetical protein
MKSGWMVTHFVGVGVVGVVHQLANQLDALGIEPLAEGSDVAFIHGDGNGGVRYFHLNS